jgi:hypothetical protein
MHQAQPNASRVAGEFCEVGVRFRGVKSNLAGAGPSCCRTLGSVFTAGAMPCPVQGMCPSMLARKLHCTMAQWRRSRKANTVNGRISGCCGSLMDNMEHIHATASWQKGCC